MARLDVFHDLLVKWQRRINLVAPASLSQAWHRHFLDSVQVFDASPSREGIWLDIGSGAGFPGLVCAILARDTAPDLAFHLADSDQRKCAFLREVARQTDTPVTLHAARLETLLPLGARIVSARALAPLPRLCDWAAPHLAPDGCCLFQKGAGWREELESAAARWQMMTDILPSITAADSVILRIRNLAHAV